MKKYRRYSKEDLKTYWDKWKREYDGRQPIQEVWKKEAGYPSIRVIRGYYGSWNNFVKEAGGNPKNTRYTKEDLAKFWKKWKEEHNEQQPTSEIWKKKLGCSSFGPIEIHYGSWNNFVKEMGGKVIARGNIEDSIYADKNYRKDVVNKVLETVGKNPEQLSSYDFEKSAKKIGGDYSAILSFYKKKFRVKTTQEALNILKQDLYDLREVKKDYSLIAQGIEAYLQYAEKCKAKGKNPISLQRFFNSYDPNISQFLGWKRWGPLARYVSRYKRKIKKLEGKVQVENLK